MGVEMNNKENQKIIDSFWDAVPDNATWEDLNKGIDVFFK